LRKLLLLRRQKDGTPLPRGRHHLSGGNLTIAEVRKEDRGVYQCVASNGAGTISAETTLALENQAPRPPFNLRALSASTSVTLSWQSGSERPPKTYSIWYVLSEGRGQESYDSDVCLFSQYYQSKTYCPVLVKQEGGVHFSH